MFETSKNVSIVIATYNGAAFIVPQLESILEQSFRPKEIILSDDASTDNTLSLVSSIASKSDIPVKIIRNETPLGFRDNFLHAASHATGDFIAFCDQDDIWERDKLERCAAYFDDRHVSLIVHQALSFDSASGRSWLFSQGIGNTRTRPPLSYDPWMTFFGFSIVFRRELLLLADFEARFKDFIAPAHKIAHDRWIMFLGQMVGETVEIGAPLVRYRQHGANLFGDGKNKKRNQAGNLVSMSEDYIIATEGMIAAVESFPEEAKALFPLFDKLKAISFLEAALRQLKNRKDVYTSTTRLASFRQIVGNAASGTYVGVHNHAIRWRSLAKDVSYLVKRDEPSQADSRH
ncbi:glycosyltransferase [Oryzifoliimicrobium ureilyticus]|uniref:glycosyltransferase n=1 Tax=Oryzifoliimicrobium ureilyticus TaxID=3113724 RepID=UPI0030763A1A